MVCSGVYSFEATEITCNGTAACNSNYRLGLDGPGGNSNFEPHYQDYNQMHRGLKASKKIVCLGVAACEGEEVMGFQTELNQVLRPSYTQGPRQTQHKYSPKDDAYMYAPCLDAEKCFARQSIAAPEIFCGTSTCGHSSFHDVTKLTCDGCCMQQYGKPMEGRTKADRKTIKSLVTGPDPHWIRNVAKMDITFSQNAKQAEITCKNPTGCASYKPLHGDWPLGKTQPSLGKIHERKDHAYLEPKSWGERSLFGVEALTLVLTPTL